MLTTNLLYNKFLKNAMESGATTPPEATVTPPEPRTPATFVDSGTMLSLEALQSDEQRRVLDMVRACG